ncbi:glycoside hydrolase superfamily [Dactylonectria macrodidyma]|uniref:Probable glucan endo-1,3-beta-glucosidase eglC n=1 Tax=Dactylonectria macrodidyma TaxID=307937 RepID=A0A9P9FHE4_9HYPO|nr:glycoside hydrolase superfamily [Dactylonectria macrodidyma]
MKLLNSVATLAAAILLLPGQAMAGTYKGFSMGANRADGACKSQADWKKDFQTIKGWGKGFNAVRLYATSDCNTLANAVPAAKATGIKLLVGVWATDDGHFGAEKAALLKAIKTHGTGWIAAISVGSEDLYRKDITPQKLATQIYDVRGMVRQYNKNLKVGHTDTWTAWVDGANDVVTKACDIAITNGFPYWQGVNSKDAIRKKTFQNSFWSVQKHVKQVNSKAKVWVGETGWPTAGASFQGAAATTTSLKNYYASVACWLWAKPDTSGFWFTAFDAPTASPEVEKHFGIADSKRKLKFALPC